MSDNENRSMRDVLKGSRTVVHGPSEVSKLCAKGVDSKVNQLVEDASVLTINALLSTLRLQLACVERHEGLRINYTYHNDGLLFFKPSTLEAKRCVRVAHSAQPGRLVVWFTGTGEIDRGIEQFYDLSIHGVIRDVYNGDLIKTPARCEVISPDFHTLTLALIEYLA